MTEIEVSNLKSPELKKIIKYLPEKVVLEKKGDTVILKTEGERERVI